MSRVTNVVVHVAYCNNEVKEELVEDLPFHHDSGGLERLDYKQIAGVKVFEDDIYAAAFNYLDTEDLISWFAALPWGKLDMAVLSVSTEGEAQDVVQIGSGGAFHHQCYS